MKNTRKLLALLLSLALVFALAVPAYADYDYAANARIVRSDYTGKTVILHSNDVHGHIDGYAAMAALTPCRYAKPPILPGSTKQGTDFGILLCVCSPGKQPISFRSDSLPFSSFLSQSLLETESWTLKGRTVAQVIMTDS